MRILVLTTAYQRPELTRFHMNSMAILRDRCAPHGIDIIPFYVFSTYDDFAPEYFGLCRRLGLRGSINDEAKLSDKIQKGLFIAMNGIKWDYLMHLDSDELIAFTGVDKLVEYMDRGVNWFGPEKQIFYDAPQKRAYKFEGYRRQALVNGGSCIRREILEETNGILWTPGLQSGLNTNEHIHLKQRGYSPKVVQLSPLDLVEVKTGDDIHSLHWFVNAGYKLKELNLEQTNILSITHRLSSLEL